jgi:hypothetical protein
MNGKKVKVDFWIFGKVADCNKYCAVLQLMEAMDFVGVQWRY